uniref:NADH:ubiquinone oxidoreductase intermediate-associated protein 30 domain-containing protein n=1 Tax=Strigamia maritima TaxID=126957 RepID=T1JGP2_STRMM
MHRVCLQNILSSQKCMNLANTRHLVTSSINYSFWEPDEKGGYRKEEGLNIPKQIQLFKSGLGQLKDEIRMWRGEMKEKFLDEPAWVVEPGTTDIVWKFDNQEVLDKWLVTSDSDHTEGFSQCTLRLNAAKNATFSGILQTHLPKDGRIKKAGYCSMRSMRPRKSFQRAIYHDWDMFTHLIMRVRGDGRPYMLNLASVGYFDVMFNDIFQFVLYTRGGPYWQVAKIPFSRFFLGSKGRVQDKQCKIPLRQITNLGISCGDRLPGPFQLEIDYIAVQFDPSHKEEYAYEMYQTPKTFVGT